MPAQSRVFPPPSLSEIRLVSRADTGTSFPFPCSGSPDEIVRSHIRLLGQYNEAKDIAQQVIGLIADNRGVPVGSLYQGDRYGVGAND